MDALHDRVSTGATLVARKFIGVDGGAESTGPPPHGPPLTVQLSGSPSPSACQPKVVEAFGGRVPFHGMFVKT